jgi:Protein of unknown function (DUF2934)
MRATLARCVLAIVLNISGDSLMDVTPSDPTPKRSKSKAKVEAAPKKEPAKKSAVSAKPVKAKKARVAVPVTVTPAQIVAAPAQVVSTAGLTLTDLQHEIAVAAYFLAAQRNFAPGFELDDWLQAERQVREARIA